MRLRAPDSSGRPIMARPKQETPTPAELEVLQLLWDEGPKTGREVMEALNRDRRRAYTSVTSLLNVMCDKGLLMRRPHGRAFRYAPKVQREQTLRFLVSDLLGRAFRGSASTLVAHLLDETHPSPTELEQLHKLIETFEQEQRSG